MAVKVLAHLSQRMENSTFYTFCTTIKIESLKIRDDINRLLCLGFVRLFRAYFC